MGRAEAARIESVGRAEAVKVQAVGAAEASRTEAVGLAEAKAAEALGLARAEGFEAQKQALGEMATALVAVANAIAEGKITVVPEVLVTGGGGSVDGLAATLMRNLVHGGSLVGARNGGGGASGAVVGDGPAVPPAPPAPPALN